MKILARASSLAGYVDAVAAADGTIELAGLQIHMEHGAVVRVGDFVDVEATLGADRIWTGRIRAHFISSDHEGTVSPEIHTPAGAHGGTHSAAAAPGNATTLASTAASGPSAGGATGGMPAISPTDRSPQESRTGTSGGGTQAAPSGTPPASSGRRRFGGSQAAGQRTGTGPSAAVGGGSAPSRPRFTPSSADQKVSY